MEVRVEVESKDPASGTFYPLIIATFTMVATFEGKVLHLLPTIGYLAYNRTPGCSRESIDSQD